jgi:hypothetical protein
MIQCWKLSWKLKKNQNFVKEEDCGKKRRKIKTQVKGAPVPARGRDPKKQLPLVCEEPKAIDKINCNNNKQGGKKKTSFLLFSLLGGSESEVS